MEKGTPCDPGRFPAPVRAVLGEIHAVSFPAHQGYTSTVALVATARGALAVKRSTGERWCALLRREHAVLKALAATSLLVPRAHLLYASPQEHAEPACWLVMDALPGVPLRQILARERDAARREELLLAFGRALATIHATPPPAALPDTGERWLDDMLDQAAHNLAHDALAGTPELLERLRRERPAPVPPTLIHGDFTLDNILVANGRVTGVIDWAGGTSGDPRYDHALAVRPKCGAFHHHADFRAFFAGYAEIRRPYLTGTDYKYFVDLYEFF